MNVRVACAPILAGLLAAAAPAPGRFSLHALQRDDVRTIVVASDLGMGMGRERSGKWQPYEDFRWSPEFAAFLDTIDRQGQSAVDLILNGDTFELLQSADAPCAGAANGLGCTETEALARLERVLRAHETDLSALAHFARTGSNRLVFVPGDHDAALLFPGLRRRVLRAFGTPAGRVDVSASGFWSSPDGEVYAEHGHQIGFDAHKFDSWPSPFVGRGRREQLARPWGEAVIQELFNRYEPRFPVIDNIVASGVGVKYALAADVDAGDSGASLIRYLLFTMSWQQFRMELDDGDTRAPTWDVAQLRVQGPSFLVSSLPDDDPLKMVAAKALAGGRLAKSMEDLSDDEVVAVCDYRAAMRRARRRLEPLVTQFPPRGPAVAECPRATDSRGAAFDYFWRSRDLRFARHLDLIAKTPGRGRAPSVFVHGHTGLPDRSQTNANMISGGLLKIPMEGFSPVRGALTPVVINDGAWQRTITPVQFDRLAGERGIPGRDLLALLQPEDLAPCYSFVQIVARGGTWVPAVRYWRRASTGEWAIAGGCGP